MIKLKVTYLDGSDREVGAGARAEVEFERHFDIAFFDAFGRRDNGQGRRRNEWVFFLAWAALRNTDAAVEEEFDDWLKRVDDVDVIVAETANPTKRARRPAASSNSAS